MKKHNLTWYNNRIAKAEAELAEHRAMIAGIDWMTTDKGNEVYDQEHELEAKVFDLYSAKSRRNWTSCDYQQWSMVCDNCD